MIEHELRALLGVLGVLLHARVDDRTLGAKKMTRSTFASLASYVVQDAGPRPGGDVRLKKMSPNSPETSRRSA